MVDESSDILGGPLPVVRDSRAGQWSSLSLTVKSTFILALILVGYVTFIRVWEWVLRWKERSYKLSMRRKHGIPDNDHRPFNVAYAAVLRIRQENEAKDRMKHRAKQQQTVSSRDQRDALPEQNIRQRPVPLQNVDAAWSTNTPGNGLPGRFNPLYPGSMAGLSSARANDLRYPPVVSVDSPSFAHHYNPNLPIIHVVQPEPELAPARPNGSSRRSSRKDIGIKIHDDRRKRALDGEIETSEPDNIKKSRVEGDELIDGDENAEWHDRDQHEPKRGSKRILGDEDEDEEEADGPSKRKRDKRARKISLDRTPQGIDGDHVVVEEDEGMVVDEDEDELTDLKPVPRGKKRDRAEAGSTFGGDDEDSLSEAEEDAKVRRRKRRTVGKRKSDAGASLRGKKRDRDVEEESEEGEAKKRVSRKKRGKKAAAFQGDGEEASEAGGSDVSMDGSAVSRDPSCRGRRIGEEWKSNGVTYKVGPNGDRLRQALVKKARQKFNMPKDSQHPDREANLEVIVETWLTDEEFNAAKEQQMLAWQDSPKPSVEPETPDPEVQVSPTSKVPTGKDLLWTAPIPTPATPSKKSYFSPHPDQATKTTRDPYRQSIAGNLGLRINPFQQPQAPPNKRLASAARVASVFNGSNSTTSSLTLSALAPNLGTSISAVPAGLADSTNSSGKGSPRRMFSKWEKQDLEAEAMRKMREANRRKEMEKEEKEKAARAEKEKALSASTPTVPSLPAPLSFAKPGEPKPATTETKPPALSFGIPPAQNDAPKASAVTPDAGKPPPFSVPGLSAAPKLSFAPPLGSSMPAPTSDASKTQTPVKSPATSTPFGTSSGAPAPSSTSTFSFEKPPVPATSVPPTDNAKFANPSFFGGRAAPSIVGSDKNSNTPSVTFPASPAGNSSGSNSATPSAPAPSGTGGFSWGPPAQGIKPSPATSTSVFGEQKKPEAQSGQSTGDNSLLSRLGGFGGQGSGTGSGPSSGSAQPQTANSSSSTFSFANTGSETLKPAPVFGVSNTPQSIPPAPNATSNLNTTTAAPATTSGSSGLKFNFGFTGKPSNAAPSPASGATTTSSSSLTGALTDSSKPSTTPSQAPSFVGFGQSKPAPILTKPTESAASGSTAVAPKFSFGTSPSGSAFGSTSTLGAKGVVPAPITSQDTPKSAFAGFGGGGPAANTMFTSAAPPTQSSEAPKPAFTGFGGGGMSSNAFSTTSATSPSTFGGSGAGSVFGGDKANPAFGSSGSAIKPAEAPKSTFAFGLTPPAPSSGSSEPPKSAFAFDNSGSKTSSGSAAPPAGGSSGFSFKFGESSNNSTTPQASPFGAQPPATQSTFSSNKPTGPGAFGFATSPSTPSGGFTFGAPPKPTGQNQQQQ